MSVQFAKREIILGQGIKNPSRRKWSFQNTVLDVKSIPSIRRRSNYMDRLSRPVALMVERRSPKPFVGGSNPSWPAYNNCSEDI